MLYPQNGDRIIGTDSGTSLGVYIIRQKLKNFHVFLVVVFNNNNNNNNNKRICIAPYGLNFRGAGSRDGCDAYLKLAYDITKRNFSTP